MVDKDSPSAQFHPPSGQPYSGRYESDVTGPNLVLRVDIDERYPNSPVMNCVSGDLFKLSFSIYKSGIIFDKSWIAINPTINVSNSQVEITGTVKFWESGVILIPLIDTQVHIIIPRSLSRLVGPAIVTLGAIGQ